LLGGRPALRENRVTDLGLSQRKPALAHVAGPSSLYFLLKDDRAAMLGDGASTLNWVIGERSLN